MAKLQIQYMDQFQNYRWNKLAKVPLKFKNESTCLPFVDFLKKKKSDAQTSTSNSTTRKFLPFQLKNLSKKRSSRQQKQPEGQFDFLQALNVKKCSVSPKNFNHYQQILCNKQQNSSMELLQSSKLIQFSQSPDSLKSNAQLPLTPQRAFIYCNRPQAVVDKVENHQKQIMYAIKQANYRKQNFYTRMLTESAGNQKQKVGSPLKRTSIIKNKAFQRIKTEFAHFGNFGARMEELVIINDF